MRKITKQSNPFNDIQFSNKILDGKPIVRSNGRKINKLAYVKSILTEFGYKIKRSVLKTNIAERLIVKYQLNTDIYKIDLFNNLTGAYKSLTAGDACKYIKYINKARSEIINECRRTGSSYGADDFRHWTSSWLDILKKNNPQGCRGLIDQVKNSSCSLSILSAASDDLNGRLNDFTDSQAAVLSVATVYVDTVARAALAEGEGGLINHQQIDPYKYWDESKDLNAENYEIVLKELERAVKAVR